MALITYRRDTLRTAKEWEFILFKDRTGVRHSNIISSKDWRVNRYNHASYYQIIDLEEYLNVCMQGDRYGYQKMLIITHEGEMTVIDRSAFMSFIELQVYNT